MGMFDTIYPDGSNPIKAPCCGRKIESFQTKALENLMDEYCEGATERKIVHMRALTEEERKGSVFPLLAPDGVSHMEPHPKYHRFYAYDWCSACEKSIGQWFQFDEEGKLIRWEKPILEKE